MKTKVLKVEVEQDTLLKQETGLTDRDVRLRSVQSAVRRFTVDRQRHMSNLRTETK